MKKILSLILALLMTASCAATIFADDTAIADGATEETTATEATPYDHALKFLDAKKIMQGWDGELHPEKDVKRYEMAIFATRISTGIVDNAAWEDGPINGTEFTDLEGSGAANALGALSYANQHGIVNGYEDGTFKPDNTVTYRDALVMACRTLGYTGLEYKWGYIEKAVTLGLTEGITNVAYTDTITRGVAAQIVYNALEAKTADGKKLAQESFDFDYDWKQIVVVRDANRTYVPAEITAPAANHVGFKFVEKDGTFSEETLYVDNVKAGLKFGEFYKAYIGKVGGEYVDLFTTEQIVPGALITNDGNDDADGVHDDIAAALANKTLVTKYEQYGKDYSYNYSLSLKGRDEYILVTPGEDKVFLGSYSATQKGAYAIDWTTGDILKKLDDKTTGGAYEVVWHYNSTYDVYFKFVDKAATGIEGEWAGIEIMDDNDLAALKAAIEEAYKVYATKLGYVNGAHTAGYLYASLLPYDFDGDGSFDYAKYEKYAFGTYSGTSTVDCTGHKIDVYNLGGKQYPVATCAHQLGYTWVEGYAPVANGYVVYGVNDVTKELKIIKTIYAEANKTDADSYTATGVVRGFDISGTNKSITIGERTYTWYTDENALKGVFQFTDAPEAFFNTLFNQFVTYVVLDGKIVDLTVSGASATNYIVVERYLGIDNEGYIVIQGYTTDTGALQTFRIGAFDGWKQGDGFFYGYKNDIEEYFVKGNIYTITSVDTTAANGYIYYVNAFGVQDYDNGYSFEVDADKPLAEYKFEDFYRIEWVDKDGDDILEDGKEYTEKTSVKMTANDTYVIVCNSVNEYGIKPIYIYKGIVPTNHNDMPWSVKGDLFYTNGTLHIFVNVHHNRVLGFDDKATTTSFVATLNNFAVLTASYDGYPNSGYYYYGATKYTIKALDILTGKADTTVTAYNFKPEKNSVYATVDGQIVGENSLTYAEFKTAMNAAYGDGNLWFFGEDLDNTTYIPFLYEFTAADDKNAEKLSEEMSTTLFNYSKKYKDLLKAVNYKFVELTGGTDANGDWQDVKNIRALAADDIDFTAYKSVEGFGIYDVVNNTVNVYFTKYSTKVAKPAPINPPADAVAQPDPSSTNVIKVAEGVLIDATAGLKATAVMAHDDASDKDYIASYTYEIESLTFNWEGDFIDHSNHATIEEKEYYFGNTGAHTTESWNASQGVATNYSSAVTITRDTTVYDDQVEGVTYTACDEEGADCDLINSVKVVLDAPVAVTDKWTAIQVRFETHTLDANGAKTDLLNYVFTVVAKLNAAGNVEFKFNNNAADLNKNSDGVLAVVAK